MNTLDRQDPGFDDGVTGLSVRDIATVLFKRWQVIVASTVLVVLAVLAAGVLKTPTYMVTAGLLVTESRAEVPLAPGESRQLVADVSDKDLNSEVEVLRSRQLIETVLKTLGFTEVMEPTHTGQRGVLEQIKDHVRAVLGKPKLTPFQEMVVQVQKHLSIASLPRSNVIRVTFTSEQPEFAIRFVKGLTETYIEERVERYQSPQVVAFFEEQMYAAEERLRIKEDALKEVSASAQITMTKGLQGSDALEEQKKMVLNRLARFQNDLGDAEADVQEQERSIATIRTRLAEEPERLESPDRNLEAPAQEIIEQRLADLALERDALLQDFKPDSRYIRDIDTQIELAKQRLAELDSDGEQLHGTEVNPIHRELKARLLEAESEYEGTRARYESLQAQVVTYQRELDELNRKAFQLEALRREAQAAEQEYLLYRRKYEEARISAAMDQQRLINVSIAQPAQRSLQPVGRGITTALLLGVLVGLIGGVGLAFGIELYVDRSFTTGRDVERRLGIPHLASIPEGGL